MMSVASQGLLQQNKARTTKALVEAAFELFQLKGYGATTVEEITERAKVSRRTFFRYFATKEAVVFHQRRVFQEQFRRYLAESDPRNGPYQVLLESCNFFSKMFMEHREMFQREHAVIANSTTLQAYDMQVDLDWEQAICSIFERALPRDSENQYLATLLGGAVFGMLRATMRQWIDGNCQDDLTKRLAFSMELLKDCFPGMNRHLMGK